MTVGVLGAGQLGRMLALAGAPLGIGFRFLDPSPDAPAGRLGELVTGAYGEEESLRSFSAGLELATYEFENVPLSAVRILSRSVPVLPPSKALEIAQDRVREKEFFSELGIPAAPFREVSTAAVLREAARELGYPSIMKTRRLGYDGKGQLVLRTGAELESACARMPGEYVVEKLIPFDRELSLIAVRGKSGHTKFYPLVENLHRDGILVATIAPASNVPAAMQRNAEDHATRVLDALGYAGVLAIELFELDGRLIANEMAPRVHNSGHWTIEGAETSQFENHLRALLGWPLGPTGARGCSAMINILGNVPDLEGLLAIPGAHVHLYGKPPRPGRKLGHVTVWADDSASRDEKAALLRAALGG